MVKTIKCEQFKEMITLGSQKIANEYDYINQLNVFPVPDGDTGTNMKITTSNAIKEIEDFKTTDISILGRAFSRALLMNARGNSGVIFSQIIKGFTSKFRPEQSMLSTDDLIECFCGAKEVAYGAVANPVEGTILTVIRITSEKLTENKDKYKDTHELMQDAVKFAQIALDDTPNQLEELRRVGVVDSGGYGLLCFLKGMYKSLIGAEKVSAKKEDVKQVKNIDVKLQFDEHDNEEGFGYCSEIIMKIAAKIDPHAKSKKEFNMEAYKKDLLKIGDSLVCVQDEDIVKVHVHTTTPGKFLSISQVYGEFLKIKFENMTEQYYERIKKQGISIIDQNVPVDKKINLKNEQAIVMTCPSPKIKKILDTEYGIHNVLDTNEIGNPSIQDILLLIQQSESNKVLVITDDSNIVLAANQAADIVRESVDVRIIKGSNIFEALFAALEFNPNSTFDANERQMRRAVGDARTAAISKSIKDVTYSNIELKKDDYISIINKRIEAANKELSVTLKETIDLLVSKASNPDILVIIYSSESDLKILKEIELYVTEKYGLICEFKNGGQKIYNYFIGIQ